MDFHLQKRLYTAVTPSRLKKQSPISKIAIKLNSRGTFNSIAIELKIDRQRVLILRNNSENLLTKKIGYSPYIMRQTVC